MIAEGENSNLIDIVYIGNDSHEVSANEILGEPNQQDSTVYTPVDFSDIYIIKARYLMLDDEATTESLTITIDSDADIVSVKVVFTDSKGASVTEMVNLFLEMFNSLFYIFGSPEHKVLKVSFSGRLMSVVHSASSTSTFTLWTP